MKQKLIRLSVVFILLGILVISIYNVNLAYSKSLTETIIEYQVEEIERVDFDFYATYSDNELYGSGIHQGDKFFLGITEKIEGTIAVTPSSDVSTHIILKSGNYWEKQYGTDGSTFSLNINEYRETIETINDQLGIRENKFSILIITNTGTSTSELMFQCDRTYIELISDRTFIHKKKIEIETIVPTNAEEERKNSIIYLLISFFGFIVGIVITAKKPNLFQYKDRTKLITGKEQDNIFYIDESKNLSKIAKLEGKQILFDSNTEELFFRAEGKEYRSKK